MINHSYILFFQRVQKSVSEILQSRVVFGSQPIITTHHHHHHHPVLINCSSSHSAGTVGPLVLGLLTRFLFHFYFPVFPVCEACLVSAHFTVSEVTNYKITCCKLVINIYVFYVILILR